MHRNPPRTFSICAVKKNKESSGDCLSGRVKEKKGSTLTAGEERRGSHPKRIMHGVNKGKLHKRDGHRGKARRDSGGDVGVRRFVRRGQDRERGPLWKMTGQFQVVPASP